MIVCFLNLIMKYFLGVGLININSILLESKDGDMVGVAHLMTKSGLNVGAKEYDYETCTFKYKVLELLLVF